MSGATAHTTGVTRRDREPQHVTHGARRPGPGAEPSRLGPAAASCDWVMQTGGRTLLQTIGLPHETRGRQSAEWRLEGHPKHYWF